MPTAQTTTRLTARAGQFYPGDAREMQRMIDRFLAIGDGETHPCRAIMLPHAGWVYCGETLGKTLSRCEVPETVIVLGPKHTPNGPNLSVASHEAWAIPGATIPVATGIVNRLIELHPGVLRDADAHRLEHGTEVLLPFLHRVNPNIRIVPIVLGQMNYRETSVLAEALATVVRELSDAGQRPLFVISSDMNHFGSEEENRRLDGMALDAMTAGNPRKLYDTCAAFGISMCGVLPAVTVMQALQRETPAIKPQLVDYTTSAKASGDTSRVVGYAGIIIA
jgi:AmmeMemoRadiSam system protein B